MRQFITNKRFPRGLLITLITVILSCSFELAHADYNDDVNVGNTSAQEVGDAIYRMTYFTTGLPYNHAGLYYKFTGLDHSIIHVAGDIEDIIWYQHIVKQDKFQDFKRSELEYLGAYSSDQTLTSEQRGNIISTAEQLRDRASPIYYTCWGQIDGAGLSWNGTIDDIDNLRCDGLVEVVYEMNGVDVWGKNLEHYSIVEYADEHNLVPFSISDLACCKLKTCDCATRPEPDPNIEVLPVVQRGGYGLIYTKLRASVPEPPSILIDSPPEGSEQTGLFKITALAEDESGIRHVKFEYSTDHITWLPVPGPDSESGKDGYGADGWGLRFDTVDAGIDESQVWVSVNATDKAGNTSDWTEVYYFIDNTGIIVTETLDPSTTTAGSPVTVSGNALYEGSGPVQNGTVEITTSNGSWTTTTDLDGDYSEVITAPNGSGYVYVTVSHDTSQGSAAEWLVIFDGTYVSGTIVNDRSWTIAGSPYIVTGSVTIPEGITLTISSGVMVEFTNAGSMYVGGTLNATGATFTWADGQNQWRGIWFDGAGSTASRLDGCVFEHAEGYSYSGTRGILYMTNTSPTVTGCTIHNSDASYGIWIEDGSPEISTSTISGISGNGIYVYSNSSPTVTGNTITGNGTGIHIRGGNSGTYQGNTIAGNTSYGIYNSGTTVIDARNNYWGDPTGPYDPSDDRAAGGWYNPDGQGDKVTDYVAYESWITDPTDTDGDGIPDEWEIDNFQNLTTVDENTDYDGDGLLDRHEFYNTTDPKNPDTDDDGMPDGWEVDNRLNPLVNDAIDDADGDGFCNWREYLAGTDPGDSGDTPPTTAIYVDDDNTSGVEDGSISHPFNTIQEGVDFAGPGDTVSVSAGNYVENVLIQKDIFLVGEDPDVTIIDGIDAILPAMRCVGMTDGGIEGFHIQDGSDAGIQCEQSTLSIQRNVISNTSTGNGIDVGEGSSLSIENNIIYENDQHGIGFEETAATIVNNTIVSNAGDGISCSTGDGVVIRNNIVVGNGTYGISCDQSPEPQIFYNDVWDNAADDYSGCSAGTGDISADPMFEGPKDLDYHLSAGSPCIDAGTSDGTPEFDFDENNRYDDPDTEPNTGGGSDTFYDIGAYEYFPVCKGDVDGDGDVDGSDLAVFADAFGFSSGDPNYNPFADFDHDGYVNECDLASFAKEFGRTNCVVPE